MQIRIRRIAVTAGSLGFVALALIWLSGRRAQLACDCLMAPQKDEYSRYSTCFTFLPSRYMLTREPLGHSPCWVVSYVDRSGYHSIAFNVDMLGNMLTSGKGITAPKVAERERRIRPQREQLQRLIAQADVIIEPGVSYSKLVETLGPPNRATTNNDCVFIEYNFPEFLDAMLDSPNLITVGFTACVSNNVVVWKGRITRG